MEEAPGRGGSQVGVLQREGAKAEECGSGLWLAGDSRTGWSPLAQRPLESLYSNNRFPFANFSPAPAPPFSVPALDTEESSSLCLFFPLQSSRSPPGRKCFHSHHMKDKPSLLTCVSATDRSTWKVSEITYLRCERSTLGTVHHSQLSLNSQCAKLRPSSLVPCLQMKRG